MRINCTYDSLEGNHGNQAEWRQFCTSLFFETTAQNMDSYVMWANYNHSPQHIWNNFLHSHYEGQRCMVLESTYSNSDEQWGGCSPSPRPPSCQLVSAITMFPSYRGYCVHGHYRPITEKPKSSVIQLVANCQGKKGFKHHEDRMPTETECLTNTAWAFALLLLFLFCHFSLLWEHFF